MFYSPMNFLSSRVSAKKPSSAPPRCKNGGSSLILSTKRCPLIQGSPSCNSIISYIRCNERRIFYATGLEGGASCLRGRRGTNWRGGGHGRRVIARGHNQTERLNDS